MGTTVTARPTSFKDKTPISSLSQKENIKFKKKRRIRLRYLAAPDICKEDVRARKKIHEEAVRSWGTTKRVQRRRSASCLTFQQILLSPRRAHDRSLDRVLDQDMPCPCCSLFHMAQNGIPQLPK